MKKVPVTLLITEDQKRLLIEASNREDRSLSQLLRLSLKNYIGVLPDDIQAS
jgi:hypothetical protein